MITNNEKYQLVKIWNGKVHIKNCEDSYCSYKYICGLNTDSKDTYVSWAHETQICEHCLKKYYKKSLREKDTYKIGDIFKHRDGSIYMLVLTNYNTKLCNMICIDNSTRYFGQDYGIGGAEVEDWDVITQEEFSNIVDNYDDIFTKVTDAITLSYNE